MEVGGRHETFPRQFYAWVNSRKPFRTSLVVATWLIFPFWEWVLIISFKWCAIKTTQEPCISFCLGYSILWAHLTKALFGSCACCVQKQYPRVLQVMAWNVSAAAFHLQQKERRRRHGTILFLTTLHSVCVSLSLLSSLKWQDAGSSWFACWLCWRRGLSGLILTQNAKTSYCVKRGSLHLAAKHNILTLLMCIEHHPVGWPLRHIWNTYWFCIVTYIWCNGQSSRGI